MTQIRRIRRCEMKTAARAFKHQCLHALNEGVLHYLRRHPEEGYKSIAARLGWTKAQLVRKLSKAKHLSFRDIGEIAGVIDAEVEFRLLPIEEAAISHPTSETERETL